jgi:flagella basal body P-ring formation protein FlgA
MKNLTRIFFALRLVVGGSLASPNPCAADTPVTLRGTTEVKRIAVRLSDVFNGVPNEIDRDIAQAPAPGKQVTYDVNVLTRLVEKYRLDWEPQTLADHIVISTASTRITADTIRESVIRKIKEQNEVAGMKDSVVDVNFDNRTLEINLPADQGPDFVLNNFDYDILSKRFRADLVADTSSGPFSVPLAGHISIKRNIPVLVHRLEGGTTVSATDVDWVPVSEDRVNGTVITDAKQLIGHELRRDTGGGEVLHTSDVIPPRLITRGSLITLKIQTAYMQLTAQGKALQDGTQGDVIRVINTQSNRLIEGTVSGPGVVTIKTTQIVATIQ